MNDTVTLALLAVVLILLFSVVYAWPRKNANGSPRRRAISPTFARIYGLLAVAGFAAVLSAAVSDAAILTPAFTLFGTIAGYLAGAKAENVQTRTADTRGTAGGQPPDADGDRDGDATRAPSFAEHMELN